MTRETSRQIRALMAGETLTLEARTRKEAQAIRSMANYAKRTHQREDNLFPSCHWIVSEGLMLVSLQERADDS